MFGVIDVTEEKNKTAQALRYIKEAWVAGVIFGSFNLLFVIVAAAEGDTAQIVRLFDSALCFGLSYGIYKKSRVAAILLFFYSIAAIVMAVLLPRGAVGIMAYVLTFVVARGILGTFRYRKFRSRDLQVGTQA